MRHSVLLAPLCVEVFVFEVRLPKAGAVEVINTEQKLAIVASQAGVEQETRELGN